MTSLDSNLLLYCYSQASPFHAQALSFLEGLSARDDVTISELVLVELYTLLRNPAVLVNPLEAAAMEGDMGLRVLRRESEPYRERRRANDVS